MVQTPTVIDLFCGCGGIATGIRDAGFRVLAGVDIEPRFMTSFEHNFPDAHSILSDIAQTAPQDFMERIDIHAGDLDLLVGGPPCQGFSKNVPRKQRIADSQNNKLVLSFLKYAEALLPKAIIMENVAEMKNGFNQSYTNAITDRLADIGYTVNHMVMNAADYGVPQRRRRAFFVGLLGETAFTFPQVTHSSNPNILPGFGDQHITVWEAIGDLPSVPHTNTGYEHEYRCDPFSDYQMRVRRDSTIVKNHRPRRLKPLQYERLANLSPGQSLRNLPEHLRAKAGYSGAYGRLTKDMVAPTITRWVFHPGSGRFGHPEDIRVLTIREAARIQGFPDTFEFIGTYNQQAGQVGNAVPPLLAQKIGESIRKVLDF